MELVALLGSLGLAGELLGLRWGEEEYPVLGDCPVPALFGFSRELDLDGDLE